MKTSWEKFEDIIKSMNTEENFEKLNIGADFSAKLIKARLKKNLTQTMLAEKAGLKQSAIARIEKQGNLPRLDTIYKIAEALDSTIDFHPVNLPEHNAVEYIEKINGKLFNLEMIINNLTEEVKTLKKTIQKQTKNQLIIHISRDVSKREEKDVFQYRVDDRLKDIMDYDGLQEYYKKYFNNIRNNKQGTIIEDIHQRGIPTFISNISIGDNNYDQYE